jgi:hypothetical protein
MQLGCGSTVIVSRWTTLEYDDDTEEEPLYGDGGDGNLSDLSPEQC